MRPQKITFGEPCFVSQACGKRGADVRPNFHWNARPVGGMGYRKSFCGEANKAN
jgi:hypothetical protein